MMMHVLHRKTKSKIHTNYIYCNCNLIITPELHLCKFQRVVVAHPVIPVDSISRWSVRIKHRPLRLELRQVPYHQAPLNDWAQFPDQILLSLSCMENVFPLWYFKLYLQHLYTEYRILSKCCVAIKVFKINS